MRYRLRRRRRYRARWNEPRESVVVVRMRGGFIDGRVIGGRDVDTTCTRYAVARCWAETYAQPIEKAPLRLAAGTSGTVIQAEDFYAVLHLNELPGARRR